MIEWISVKDDLPKLNVEVLVHWTTGLMVVTKRFRVGESCWGDGDYINDCAITHWAEIQPPERK
jgi:hypothetical protein